MPFLFILRSDQQLPFALFPPLRCLLVPVMSTIVLHAPLPAPDFDRSCSPSPADPLFSHHVVFLSFFTRDHDEPYLGDLDQIAPCRERNRFVARESWRLTLP